MKDPWRKVKEWSSLKFNDHLKKENQVNYLRMTAINLNDFLFH